MSVMLLWPPQRGGGIVVVEPMRAHLRSAMDEAPRTVAIVVAVVVGAMAVANVSLVRALALCLPLLVTMFATRRALVLEDSGLCLGWAVALAPYVWLVRAPMGGLVPAGELVAWSLDRVCPWTQLRLAFRAGRRITVALPGPCSEANQLARRVDRWFSDRLGHGSP